MKSPCWYPFDSGYFVLQTFHITEWNVDILTFVKRLIEVDNGSSLLTAADYEYKWSRMKKAVQSDHSFRGVCGYHVPGTVRRMKYVNKQILFA